MTLTMAIEKHRQTNINTGAAGHLTGDGKMMGTSIY